MDHESSPIDGQTLAKGSPRHGRLDRPQDAGAVPDRRVEEPHRPGEIWVKGSRAYRATTAELNKGESRNGLVRAFNLHRLGRLGDRSQENSRSGRPLSNL
jgi:hypothetical protein